MIFPLLKPRMNKQYQKRGIVRQKSIFTTRRPNFFKVPFSEIQKIKSINVGDDLSLYRLTQKMFKTSKKIWLLAAFLMFIAPSFSEIFKPAVSFHLEDSLGGKIKLSSLPMKTDLVTKVQLKENKLKVHNEHDQLTIKLKIKIDKDLQHYDVEKDEDSSECSKEEKQNGQHHDVKDWKDSKITKESSLKESPIVATIVRPEIKLNPTTITKIIENLPSVTSTSSKVITTSPPIITSTHAPSDFVVTSNVHKEDKSEPVSAKKDEKGDKTINNVLPPPVSLIKPVTITVGKTLEDSKSTPVLVSSPIIGAVQATKEEPKHVDIKQKEEGEKKISTPVAPTLTVSQPLMINNVFKPTPLTGEYKPVQIKKEAASTKSTENAKGDVKKPEKKAAETIKNVANPNSGRVVLTEQKPQTVSIVKSEEKIVKPEEKKDNILINNVINPKFDQETIIKPAFISQVTPKPETEMKKFTGQDVLRTAPVEAPKRIFFADATNLYEAKNQKTVL